MAKQQQKCPECESIPAWLTSFGDLMALLLTFFVLLLSFSTTSQNDFQKALGALQGALGVLDGEPILSSPVELHIPVVKGDITEARPTLKDAKAEIEKEIEAEGQQENVQVVQGPEGIVIRIRDRAAFDSGLAEIKDEFKSLLSRIGVVVNQMSNEVEIEGHTDDMPISNDEFANNHWLSSARALQVLDYFADEVGVEKSRLSAKGYGEFRPLVPNDSFASRAKNRRVEIRLKYSAGSEEVAPDSLRKLIDAVGLGVEEQE